MSKFIAGKLPTISYTQIPNHLIRNSKISDGAFRLICWISSHQEGFEFSFKSIKHCLGYGRDKLRSIIKESEEANHLVRNRINGDDGLFDWEYHIFLSPNDAIAYKIAIDGFSVDGDNHVGIIRNMVEPPTVEPAYGSTTPHIEEQYKENQKEENQSENISPTPQNFIEGEMYVATVEVVSQDQEVAADFLFDNQSEVTDSQIKNVPALENDSQFHPYLCKIPKNGKEYFPWEGLIYKQGRQKAGNEPGFVGYMCKYLLKYDRYRKLTVTELRMAADKFINDTHKPGRIQELENAYDDFCNGSRLPEITVEEIKQQAIANNLMSMLSNRSQP